MTLGLPEIVWNMLGTVWLLTESISCKKDAPLWILVEGIYSMFVTYNFFRFPFDIIIANDLVLT